MLTSRVDIIVYERKKWKGSREFNFFSLEALIVFLGCLGSNPVKNADSHGLFRTTIILADWTIRGEKNLPSWTIGVQIP